MFQGGWQRSYWTTSIWNPVWLSHTNSEAVSHQSVTVHAFPKINSECLAGIRNTGFSCRHFFPFWICFLDLIATHYKARNIFLIQWHGHISSKNKDNNKTDQILIRKQGIIVEQNCLAVIENWKKSVSQVLKCSLLVSQCVPVNPSAHWHVYWFMPSSHVAPFSHGPDAHSSISTDNVSSFDKCIISKT